MSADSFADVLLDAPMITGETMSAETARPFLDTLEPTAEESAALLRELLAAGTVARLDALHDALRAAYRRGRAAERSDVAQLAESSVATFQAALAQRSREQAAQADLPWYLQ